MNIFKHINSILFFWKNFEHGKGYPYESYEGLKINTPLFEIEFLNAESVPKNIIFNNKNYSGHNYTKVKVKIYG